MADENADADGAVDTTAGTDTSAQTQGKADASTDQGAAGEKAGKTQAGGKPAPAADTTAGGKTGGDDTVAPYWREDWREKLAESIATDDKDKDKKLRQLKRYADPTQLALKAFNLEAKLSSGLVKVPGAKATDDEKAEWREALGVPKEAKGYLDGLKLEDGFTLGDDDKPIAESFASAMHPLDLTPTQVSAAINWYFHNQQEQAAKLYENDQSERRDMEAELRQDWGAGYDSEIRAIPTIFADAPGGADPNNEDSFMADLLGGRTASGHLIGNYGPFVRWANGLAKIIDPAATVVPPGANSGATVDARIAEIEKVMRTDRRSYDKNSAMQEEYRKLLDARARLGGKAA